MSKEASVFVFQIKEMREIRDGVAHCVPGQKGSFTNSRNNKCVAMQATVSLKVSVERDCAKPLGPHLFAYETQTQRVMHTPTAAHN